MDPWIIAVIVIVVLLIVGVIIGLIIFFVTRRRNRTPEEENFDNEDNNEQGPLPIDEIPVPPPLEPLEPCPIIPGFANCALINVGGNTYSVYPFQNKAMLFTGSNFYIVSTRGTISTTVTRSNEWSYDQLIVSNLVSNQCLRLFSVDPDLGTCSDLRNQDLWLFDGYNFYNYQSLLNGIAARLEFDYISSSFYLVVTRISEIGRKIIGTITVV
jgi:hypothetical protein